MSGSLYLLPNLLGKESELEASFPQNLSEIVEGLDGLICENEKLGRGFLSHFKLSVKPNQFPLAVVNGKTPFKDMDFYLEPMQKGENWGYVSDCGLPCIADPGSQLVVRARQNKIPIKACMGPSSIIMALMLSGFPSQKFMFQSYLAREPLNRKKEIMELEKLSLRFESTQVFIEAPYRNEYTLQDLVSHLHPQTLLAIACDLMQSGEEVYVKRVENWREQALPDISKRPTVFMFLARERKLTRS